MSEIATLTDRLLSEVATQEPLSLEEELRLARLVAEGKEASKRLAEPGVPPDDRHRLEDAAAQGREAPLGARRPQPPARGAHDPHRWSGIPIMDLFREGVLGLLRAAERFDWTRGTPFGAYASWWVRHAMSKAVREATTSVRLPDGLRSSLTRLAKARGADRSACWKVLAERTDVDAREAENLLPLLGPPLSLQHPLVPHALIHTQRQEWWCLGHV